MKSWSPRCTWKKTLPKCCTLDPLTIENLEQLTSSSCLPVSIQMIDNIGKKISLQKALLLNTCLFQKLGTHLHFQRAIQTTRKVLCKNVVQRACHGGLNSGYSRDSDVSYVDSSWFSVIHPLQKILSARPRGCVAVSFHFIY